MIFFERFYHENVSTCKARHSMQHGRGPIFEQSRCHYYNGQYITLLSFCTVRKALIKHEGTNAKAYSKGHAFMLIELNVATYNVAKTS
jgi:hypothetical protein